MIIFDELKFNKFKTYGGRNGNKICIVYNDEDYMLKFPPKANLNKDMSYSNGCINEYISSSIYNMLGIEAQKTFLGKYKEKITVACKDFEVDGYLLKDFASLKNTIIESEQEGYGTDLEDILLTIEQQDFVNPKELKEYFWDMFIVDSFLGNFDRHNGNWGFLVNGKNYTKSK